MLLALSKQALFRRAWLVRYRLFYDPPIFYPPIQILYELIHIHKYRIEIYRYKNYENIKLSALLRSILSYTHAQKYKNTDERQKLSLSHFAFAIALLSG